MAEEQGPSELRIGLWLGSGNRIERLTYGSTGWWTATDTTGVPYDQRDIPGGLHASEQCESGTEIARRPRVPWPTR